MSFKDVLIDQGKTWLCSMYIIDHNNLTVTLIISLIITLSIPTVGCWILLSYVEYTNGDQE